MLSQLQCQCPLLGIYCSHATTTCLSSIRPCATLQTVVAGSCTFYLLSVNSDDDEDDDFGFGEFDVGNLDDDPEEAAPVPRKPTPVVSNTGQCGWQPALCDSVCFSIRM